MSGFSRRSKAHQDAVQAQKDNAKASSDSNGVSQAEMQYMLDRIAELERKQNEQEHKLHNSHRDAVIKSQEISLMDKHCTNDPHGHECITYLGKVCNEYPEIHQCSKDFYN